MRVGERIRDMAENGPRLPAVLLAGWPGSGKSTVGQALARRLRATLVDQDAVTGPLVAVVADLVGVHDLDDERLAGPTRQPRYQTIVHVAEENLRIGNPVVLVAPFSLERRDLHTWESLERRLRGAGGGAPLVGGRPGPPGAGGGGGGPRAPPGRPPPPAPPPLAAGGGA